MPTTQPIEQLESRQMLAAQTYDWKAATIKANGFIDGIVYSPTEPGLVYMHTDMGGAYRYDQSRSRWTPLNDFSKYNDPAAKHMGVETLAIDPTDPDRVYMGIGTYLQDSAVLRSTDRGQTWARTNVPFQMNGNGSARNTGERMRVDPNSPNVLFYGTRDDGLFKSTDRAATWTKVNSFPTIGLDSGWGQDTGILFVEFDKSSSTAGTPTQNIYVGVFDSTAGATRIYRSTDAGTTWAALPGGQPTPVNHFPQRAVLTPDGSALYITYATSTVYPGPYGVGNGDVFKVTNPASATPTWTNVTPNSNYAFSAVTLDPTNPNTVYVSEMGNYNPADRIWRSTNGGTNWTVMNPNSHRDDSSAPYAKSSKVHWLGDLQIDPLNRNVAMFTTGYGLYRTTNLTAAEPSWTFFNEGFEQSAAIELVSPNGGPVNLISAIGDRDGYRHADFDVSPPEGTLGSNTGMSRGTSPDIDVAWNDANRWVRLVKSAPYVQTSADNGITWTWLNANTPGADDDGSLALSADGTRVVYEPAGNTNRLVYATRTGTTWSGWTSPATNVPNDDSKLTVDLVDGSTFYSQSGRTISRSTDGGVNWTVMTTTAPSSIRWMRAVPNNAGHLLAATSNGSGLYRSTNGGATWTRVAATTATDAYAVGVGAAAPGKTYPAIFIAGTVSGATGFHRSDDEGATWTTVSDVNHQYGAVTVIQGDPRVFGRIYIGTNGRGVVVGEPASTPATLPAGWRRDDIGTPALAGKSGGTLNAFAMAGNGIGIAGSADQFHFASTGVGGDSAISARVGDVANTSSSARAGVMIRATAAANSAFALVSQLPNGKVIFSWRTDAGSAVAATAAAGTYAEAKFVRLTRAGNTFTAAYSSDGTAWTTLGTPITINMPQLARVGLASTAGTSGQLSQASFSNVIVMGDTLAPTVTSTSFDFTQVIPAAVIRFSEDVSASLSAGDLTVTPAGGGAAIVPSDFTFDVATLTARFAFGSGLAVGDYVATLAAASVADVAGNELAAAANVQFFHLPGDINRDRSVNFSDLVILAQNYNQSNATFAKGDLNGDGGVNFSDLVILAQRYNQSIPTPPTVAAISASSSLTRGTTATPKKREPALTI